MIGIIGAMDVEVDGIKEIMTEKVTENIAGLDFVQGKLKGVEVVVVRCSPGKVNAAACAQIMALKYNPRLIINPGVAGGVGEGLHIGDVVIGKACVEHDFDTTPFGDPPGLLPGLQIIEIPCDEAAAEKMYAHAKNIYEGQVLSGIIVTGDQFIASNEKSAQLRRDFNALACEMEGGAIGHVCYMNKIPYVVLRTISDNGNDDATMDFPTFCDFAAKKEVELLNSCITEL